jgi:hypothetical protein
MAPVEICRQANHAIKHMEYDSTYFMCLMDAFPASLVCGLGERKHAKNNSCAAKNRRGCSVGSGALHGGCPKPLLISTKKARGFAQIE